MLWEWENGGTRVYVLDLDGTLMPSAEIDNACYWQAVFGFFDRHGPIPDLHGFQHVSDSGILQEWCRRELGREPGAGETRQIKQLFGQHLETAHTRQPHLFSPMPGATDWLTAISASGHVFAGIATGGWEHSARLKLKLSGLDRFALPLASADDAVRRTDIMQIAVQRLPGSQVIEKTAITYIGDGVWDLLASRELDWDFIGIASGQRAAQLKQAGADNVRENFCKT